jgi:hypothetical protein
MTYTNDYISDTGKSLREQVLDAYGFLANSDNELDMGPADQFRDAFPRWHEMTEDEAEKAADWLETHSRIEWWNGMPVLNAYDHPARPDDDPEPGDRCKDCGEDITWIGPSVAHDWMHVDDFRNK